MGLAFKEFNLTHFNMFFIAHNFNIFLMNIYIIVLLFFHKKENIVDIYYSGPNIEPCGSPLQISGHLRYNEPTLDLYFLH